MNSPRRFSSIVLVVSLLGPAVAGCGADPDIDAPGAAAEASQASSKLVIPEGAIELVPDRYIVLLADTASPPGGPAARAATARALVLRHGLPEQAVVHVYEAALDGFAASMSESEARRLARDPDVALVEQDQVMVADSSWGLDRIDQRYLPLDNHEYDLGDRTGSGVDVYILDTGIASGHPDFGGRVVSGRDFVGGGTEDCHGHGTHVAGTVGGATYGVAKGVTLYAVRVLNCQGSGYYSGIIAGVDWVTANHGALSVANMSLGGGPSTALDNAITNSIGAGVTYVVAAGNSNFNACRYSPARVAPAITVGATTAFDARASFSNYGSCVDLFAPGVGIESAWLNGGSAFLSGTSMASPHACGAAALHLQAHPGASPGDVAAALTGAATPNVVSKRGPGSPNLLLYVPTP